MGAADDILFYELWIVKTPIHKLFLKMLVEQHGLHDDAEPTERMVEGCTTEAMKAAQVAVAMHRLVSTAVSRVIEAEQHLHHLCHSLAGGGSTNVLIHGKQDSCANAGQVACQEVEGAEEQLLFGADATGASAAPCGAAPVALSVVASSTEPSRQAERARQLASMLPLRSSLWSTSFRCTALNDRRHSSSMEEVHEVPCAARVFMSATQWTDGEQLLTRVGQHLLPDVLYVSSTMATEAPSQSQLRQLHAVAYAHYHQQQQQQHVVKGSLTTTTFYRRVNDDEHGHIVCEGAGGHVPRKRLRHLLLPASVLCASDVVEVGELTLPLLLSDAPYSGAPGAAVAVDPRNRRTALRLIPTTTAAAAAASGQPSVAKHDVAVGTTAVSGRSSWTKKPVAKNDNNNSAPSAKSAAILVVDLTEDTSQEQPKWS